MKTLEQRISILEKRILKEAKNYRVNETLRGRVSDWNVKPINFSRFEELSRRSHSEGIVLLGAGGNTNEWIEGVSEMLFDEGIATTKSPSDLFRGAYILKTSGGRNDLALLFNKPFPADLGRMAMWRLRFGDCSWVSDYVVNYRKQHY